MDVKFTLDHGGYALADGDIQIVGVVGDVKHGERGRCAEDHAHSKACARAILDVKPVVEPARKDDEGNDVPEVLGKSLRERMEEWFAQYEATPDDAAPVPMPKKTVRVKNDRGKLVDQEVDDRDL